MISISCNNSPQSDEVFRQFGRMCAAAYISIIMDDLDAFLINKLKNRKLGPFIGI